jgi:hypothetical protein
MAERPAAFPDLPLLDELGASVREAALREERGAPRRGSRGARARRPVRTLVLAAAFFVLLIAAAAAATMLVLRGAVIPAPAPSAVPAEMTPQPGSADLLDLRADDPGDGPAFALRLSRSATGLVCTSVGQVRDDEFGVVGLDEVFRVLPVAVVDGCGRVAPGAPLLGARVFDAPKARDVRTVVHGVGGEALTSAVVEVGGERRDLEVSQEGAFLTVVRGYPEGARPLLSLRYADGSTVQRRLGSGPRVVADTDGLRAWSLETSSVGNEPELCVRFFSARQTEESASAPVACGLPTRSQYWFAARTLRTGERGFAGLTPWRWDDGPPRTAIWGRAGANVERIEVRGPDSTVRPAISRGRGFVVVYPPTVPAGSVEVTFFLEDGSVRRHRGSTNLVAPPGEAPFQETP